MKKNTLEFIDFGRDDRRMRAKEALRRTVKCKSPRDRFLWRRFYEGNKGDVLGPNMWPFSPFYTQGRLSAMVMELMQQLVDRQKAPTPMKAGARPELVHWQHRAYGQSLRDALVILKEWGADFDLRLKNARARA